MRIMYLCWFAAEPLLAMRQNGLLDAGRPQGEEQAGKQTELWGYVCFGRGPTPLC